MSLRTILAEIGLSSGCQQGRLLLLSTDRSLVTWITSTVFNTATLLVLCMESSEHIVLLLHDLHWLWVPRVDAVPPLFSDVQLSQWYSSILPHWEHLSGGWHCKLLPSSLVSYDNSNYCFAQLMINLGWWGIPVAASWTWKCLRSALRAAPSLVVFWWELNVFLYHLKFVNHWAQLTVLCPDCIKCPFSVCTTMSL